MGHYVGFPYYTGRTHCDDGVLRDPCSHVSWPENAFNKVIVLFCFWSILFTLALHRSVCFWQDVVLCHWQNWNLRSMWWSLRQALFSITNKHTLSGTVCSLRVLCLQAWINCYLLVVVVKTNNITPASFNVISKPLFIYHFQLLSNSAWQWPLFWGLPVSVYRNSQPVLLGVRLAWGTQNSCSTELC